MVMIVDKNHIEHLFIALKNDNVIPEHVSSGQFKGFLENQFSLLNRINHFFEKNKSNYAEFIKGCLSDLYCAGGKEDLIEDLNSFEFSKSINLDNISFEFTEEDFNYVQSVFKDRFVYFSEHFNLKFVRFLVEKHVWLLLEVKNRTLSDTYARDGFIEWACKELTGEYPINYYSDSKGFYSQVELFEKNIKNKFSNLELVK